VFRSKFINLLALTFHLLTVGGSTAYADLNPFPRTSFGLDLTRNYPATVSQDRFEPGHAHPALVYRYSLNRDWSMAVSGQFKIWNYRPTEERERRQLAIWALIHEASRVVRLSHPYYMFVGAKTMYLAPSRGAVLPMQRDPDLPVEIGGGLTIGLIHIRQGGSTVGVRSDFWRGTRTSKLQGLEVAVTFTYPLDRRETP